MSTQDKGKYLTGEKLEHPQPQRPHPHIEELRTTQELPPEDVYPSAKIIAESIQRPEAPSPSSHNKRSK